MSRRSRRLRRAEVIEQLGKFHDPDLVAVPPEDVIAAIAPLLMPERIATLEAGLTRRLGSMAVVLENLHDPFNGAAVLRSAEAHGVQRVFVAETTEPFRLSSRVTGGTDKWLDVARFSDIEKCLREVKKAGFLIAAAAPRATVDLEELDVTRPLALVFGNEHEGLTEQALALCDVRYQIPMSGMVESLNLSVSAAISIYACARRRRAHLGATGDLDQADLTRLRARWYAMDVRGAAAIVRRYRSERG